MPSWISNIDAVTDTLATPCTWCVVESACGVICANLPTLRPLAKMVSSRFGSTDKSGSKSKSVSRGPTELVTIGGSHHTNSKLRSQFQLLDDESRDVYTRETTVTASHTNYSSTQVKTTTHTGYSSSGDSYDDNKGEPQGHGHEQPSKGFV